MSESPFPFGASADSDVTEPVETGGGRKPLLLVGGLVGALVLGAGAFFLLGGGGTDDEFALGVPASLPPAASVPAAEPEAIGVIPAASTESVGRNPFKARYIAPVAAPAPAEAPVVTPSALPLPPPPAPVLVTVQQPPPAPAPAPEQPPATYPLTLVAVSEPQPEARFVTWTFEGTEIKVLPGQRFGKYGELVVLAFIQNAEGAVDGVILQVGDASPFDAKVGQTYDVL
jgi:hypothetical protein